MTYIENQTKRRIKNSIVYNSIFFLVFLLWFSYSTLTTLPIPLFICFIILLFVIINFIIDRRQGISFNEQIIYLLLIFLPVYLFVNIMVSYKVNSPIFFFPFESLVGIKHNHNIILILLYFAIILLKLIGVKIYFAKNVKFFEEGRGEEIFQYFTRNLTYKKVLISVILFPLRAFVEELIYRSFLLSVVTYYTNWNYIISIIFISIIFGMVHYSTSHNWGHVISTLISSIIYSLALIQLGLLYPWIFHLTTNVFVLLFYHQGRKKNIAMKSPNIMII